MGKHLFQWNYAISGLIPNQAKLKRRMWLKKDEILLEKKGKELFVYVLGSESDHHVGDQKILPYLWMSALISNNPTELSGGSGASIASIDELGTKPIFSATASLSLPQEALPEIEKYAPQFLISIRKLHDKYFAIVNENEFMKIAMEYFYDSESKFVYRNEGFISAMICLEALFNEGPSDIKYKLSHRAAFLLGLCDMDSIDCFEKLKLFYNIRSKLVHGDGQAKHESENHLLSLYARRALIVFIILLSDADRRKQGKKKRKENLLREIDYAMLEESKRKLLKKEINRKISQFKLKVPRTFEGEGYRVSAW